MSLEWQNPNAEIPKPVEKSEQFAAIQNFEQELSPEQVEQIMAKLQDIESQGVAFTILNTSGLLDINDFETILKDGVLGRGGSGEEKNLSLKEEWAKRIRNKQNLRIFLNIVGKSRNPKGDGINHSHFLGKNAVVLTFDISNYKFGTPEYFKNIKPFFDSFKERQNVVRQSIPYHEEYHDPDEIAEIQEGSGNPIDINKLPRVNSEFGFTTSFRIKPRQFRGLVLNYTSLEEVKKYINEQKKVHEENPDLLIPVYDVSGNLLWPKQMSHEEVQKLVAERDAKNTNKEEK